MITQFPLPFSYVTQQFLHLHRQEEEDAPSHSRQLQCSSSSHSLKRPRRSIRRASKGHGSINRTRGKTTIRAHSNRGGLHRQRCGRSEKAKEDTPEWNDAKTDLSKYRATEDEILRRKLNATSVHLLEARREYKEHLEKLKTANGKERTTTTGGRGGSSSSTQTTTAVTPYSLTHSSVGPHSKGIIDPALPTTGPDQDDLVLPPPRMTGGRRTVQGREGRPHRSGKGVRTSLESADSLHVRESQQDEHRPSSLPLSRGVSVRSKEAGGRGRLCLPPPPPSSCHGGGSLRGLRGKAREGEGGSSSSSFAGPFRGGSGPSVYVSESMPIRSSKPQRGRELGAERGRRVSEREREKKEEAENLSYFLNLRSRLKELINTPIEAFRPSTSSSSSAVSYFPPMSPSVSLRPTLPAKSKANDPPRGKRQGSVRQSTDTFRSAEVRPVSPPTPTHRPRVAITAAPLTTTRAPASASASKRRQQEGVYRCDPSQREREEQKENRGRFLNRPGRGDGERECGGALRELKDPKREAFRAPPVSGGCGGMLRERAVSEVSISQSFPGLHSSAESDVSGIDECEGGGKQGRMKRAVRFASPLPAPVRRGQEAHRGLGMSENENGGLVRHSLASSESDDDLGEVHNVLVELEAHKEAPGLARALQLLAASRKILGEGEEGSEGIGGSVREGSLDEEKEKELESQTCWVSAKDDGVVLAPSPVQKGGKGCACEGEPIVPVVGSGDVGEKTGQRQREAPCEPGSRPRTASSGCPMKENEVGLQKSSPHASLRQKQKAPVGRVHTDAHVQREQTVHSQDPVPMTRPASSVSFSHPPSLAFSLSLRAHAAPPAVSLPTEHAHPDVQPSEGGRVDTERRHKHSRGGGISGSHNPRKNILKKPVSKHIPRFPHTLEAQSALLAALDGHRP
uniref:Uncharacterized protein n=1 Tax=Chromera velia CCMP2878 TaxID=1169474 RepID=A0A0G4IA30_9ALVE|eukprot:Cvel_12344.t1-p1 / transcript=Cvel_12344.t1 / gene=Cvel_12344 / organism=Chromera_velia_CCMP2878 / gene_product=hypothetical protein / transcript_product=hypothetical protein / location=Cvel_scaffold803:23576-27368(-) / protein_length=910 / sequence_SO=supercontig / SO=protein_coding / is_pseudo=false